MTSIRDVAKLAGVSPSTVSRVMNGTAKVDEEKMQRVLNAISETGFKPNEVARSLFKKSSRIIGVIAPDIENPFFTEMAKSIEGEAYAQGYRMTLCYSENKPEKEKESIRMLSRMNADGIILMTNNEEIDAEIKDCGIPVVVVDRRIHADGELAFVEADHYEGGKMAARHLIQCGCRNIVNISGPQKYSSARNRYRGYVDICKQYGREVQNLECEYSFERGLLTAEEILERYPAVDGIISCNDMVAISVFKVLRRHGYQIPEDVQIIGFDNIALAHLMTPELTTIRQPIADMGKTAVRCIINYATGVDVTQENKFPVTLIKRETTVMK